MLKLTKPICFPKRQSGLTLVEILVSLVIGLIIVGGVWTLLVNSRASFSTSQNQAQMLDSARFAMHAIGRDLRLAGSYGTFTRPSEVRGVDVLGTAINDCAPQFYVNVAQKVYGTNGVNPFNGTCISDADHRDNTDILVVRYAEPTQFDNGAGTLQANMTYVHAYHADAQVFVAGTAPVFGAVSSDVDQLVGFPAVAPFIGLPVFNYRIVTHVYYIHNDSEPGDGVPSLHRISLQAGGTGPEMVDELLVSGVDDLQVQFGVRDCTGTNCDQSINSYLDADNPLFGGVAWPSTGVNQIGAVRVWLLVRSETAEQGLNTADTFNLGSRTVVQANDSIRRSVYASVFNLRNLSY
ncbi:MAG: PilW family protein [Pseudomonadota bacterium]